MLKMTETTRAAALSYVMNKLDNDVEYFILESASKTEMLVIETIKFAAYIERATLSELDKIMGVKAEGVELRAVKYEMTRTLSVKQFTARGVMIPKARTTNWQAGETAMTDAFGGIRSGDERGHIADALIEIGGRLVWAEIKNCEGRLY
jgi:hypothetical protein